MLFEQAGRFILDKLDKELPEQFYYHNANHARDVHDAAERIAKNEHIPDHDLKLLLTAAWFHDSGFLKTIDHHEEESCRIAKQILPQFEYSGDEIEKICGMIMATRLPQSPKNKLEEILADADLDYLGRDDFFPLGDAICKELNLTTRDEWNKIQLKFLQEHAYFTQTALNLRGPKKQDNLEKVKALLP